jgi:hypothetical protein
MRTPIVIALLGFLGVGSLAIADEGIAVSSGPTRIAPAASHAAHQGRRHRRKRAHHRKRRRHHR